jgi:hypothetical protein
LHRIYFDHLVATTVRMLVGALACESGMRSEWLVVGGWWWLTVGENVENDENDENGE